MIYVEAPNEYEPTLYPGMKSLFLAGGITGAPDWQSELVGIFKGLPIAVLNPRRKNFPINGPSAAEQQILWEHRHLHKADTILFWFPKDAPCPIVLYELGAWSMTKKAIVVGAEKGYYRRDDVVIQTRLARPDVPMIWDNLDQLVEVVHHWVRQDGFLR